MKKFLLSFILLTLPFIAKAETVQIDGIWYELNSKVKVAEVTSANGDNKYKGEIIIPEKIEYEGSVYNVTGLTVGAFANSEELKSVTIPSSITNININTFYGCHSLEKVFLPNSLTKIEAQAFESCWNLTDINIPDSVISIGSEAFWHCNNLTNITIGTSIRNIGNSAFGYCNKLTNVYIYDLEAWCNIDFDSNNSNPLYYAQNLYLNENIITELNIPNTVTDIRDHSFQNYTNLTSVVVPYSVNNIGNYAFSGCKNLNNVELDYSLTKIGIAAFYGCSSLKEINFPNSVTNIEIYAFFDCSSLTSITIPSSVTNIGYAAFGNCKNLTDIYCNAEHVPYVESNAFLDSYVEYATLHVPASALEDYKSTKPWSEFGNIVALTEEELAQGIHSTDMNSVQVKAQSGQITIDGVKTNVPVHIYSINGTKVASSTAKPNATLTLHTDLAIGEMAIVTIGEKSIKVVMK